VQRIKRTVLWVVFFLRLERSIGVRHRLVHRLKPVSEMRTPLQRVERAPSALKRTLAISRRFESAGLAETMTDADP
jgi:hypothetical protein